MTRSSHSPRTGTGRLASWWPVLLSLLVVLVPTVCVLWFMTEAVENRRAVVRRSLADADFTIAQERLEAYWRDLQSDLESKSEQTDASPEFFQQVVISGLADSIIRYDADGDRLYPAPAVVPPVSEAEAAIDWLPIERLEYEQEDFVAAAAAYAQIAATHGDPSSDGFDVDLAARAVLAQARCLAKADRIDQAIQGLTETLAQQAYRAAVDSHGRLLAADAELRALELIDDPTDSRFLRLAERLSGRLNDYGDPGLAASQRAFLMSQLRGLIEERLRAGDPRIAPSQDLRAALRQLVQFPTLPAEELAATYSEANPLPSKESAVRLTQSPGIWQLVTANQQVVALFRTESVLGRSANAIAARDFRSGATVTPAPPGAAATTTAELHSAEAGQYLPGWRLEHLPGEDDDLASISDAKTAAYFWTGILVIVTMSIFAAIIARSFRQQLRLTRLKNDLVASVSHELKTPLASIRLLVDTLLDQSELDQQQVREYLQLMAKENNRLTHLIDNFLAFSRMERNKHAFEFAEVDVADVIHQSVELAQERLHAANGDVAVDIEADLPPVRADADALVTVLLNLLDNACKYSPGKAQIAVRAFADNGSVSMDVRDQGVGLSKVASRKVFKRFYQVDRSVSRETGGVGLGLSIVQFIVAAHGGSIRVRSQPGHGSTFTVMLPAWEPLPGTAKELAS